MLRISYRARSFRLPRLYLTQTLTRREAHTGRRFISKTPVLKLLLFRFLRLPSTYSLDPRFHTTQMYILAIQQNANSKDLPLQSAANIAASSLYTWKGDTTRSNLWGRLLPTTRNDTSTGYSARNLVLHGATNVAPKEEGNVVPAYIIGVINLNCFILYDSSQRWSV